MDMELAQDMLILGFIFGIGFSFSLFVCATIFGSVGRTVGKWLDKRDYGIQQTD